jgi:deazaflavin-dependent oxidoreductase (nitroreductase family)
MTVSADYIPSPSDRVRDQVALYEATDGAEGGTLNGSPVIVLATVGAKTGSVRKTPLIRIEHDGTYAVVASYGGAPRDPQWYRNAMANPLVQVQDREVRQKMRAREVFGAEKDEWWRRADAAYAEIPHYRATAGREIPILLLEPAGEDATASNAPAE